MPPPRQINLKKIHIMVDRDDDARLEEIFGATIGKSKAIRIAIRRFLTEHEAHAREIIDREYSR